MCLTSAVPIPGRCMWLLVAICIALHGHLGISSGTEIAGKCLRRLVGHTVPKLKPTTRPTHTLPQTLCGVDSPIHPFFRE